MRVFLATEKEYGGADVSGCRLRGGWRASVVGAVGLIIRVMRRWGWLLGEGLAEGVEDLGVGGLLFDVVADGGEQLGGDVELLLDLGI